MGSFSVSSMQRSHGYQRGLEQLNLFSTFLSPTLLLPYRSVSFSEDLLCPRCCRRCLQRGTGASLSPDLTCHNQQLPDLPHGCRPRRIEPSRQSNKAVKYPPSSLLSFLLSFSHNRMGRLFAVDVREWPLKPGAMRATFPLLWFPRIVTRGSYCCAPHIPS